MTTHNTIRALAVIGLGCAAMLSGCATNHVEVVGEALPVFGEGAGRSDAVFDAPEAAGLIAGYDASDLPEYSRRDAALALASGQAMRAVDQWPQAPRPDGTRRWTVYIPSHLSSGYVEYTVFLPEGYRPGYHGRPYGRHW